MIKTLAKNEKANLEQLRKRLIGEIDNAWTKLQVSMEQMQRHHFHKLGELFMRLRVTFERTGRGDRDFNQFCAKHWPGIDRRSRQNYIAYRKRLGPISADRSALPP